MEVKISVADLKDLLQDRDMKEYYFKTLSDINKAFEANNLNEVKRLVDSLGWV